MLDKIDRKDMYVRDYERPGGRNYRAEEQIIKEAQEQYRSGEISGHTLSNGRGSAIPEMWEAGFNSNGKMIERKLDEKETIRIVYYPCFEEFDMDLGHIR